MDIFARHDWSGTAEKQQKLKAHMLGCFGFHTTGTIITG
jgi:hypothetical protein